MRLLIKGWIDGKNRLIDFSSVRMGSAVLELGDEAEFAHSRSVTGFRRVTRVSTSCIGLRRASRRVLYASELADVSGVMIIEKA